MRSVSLGGADHERHATALVAAGLSLGAIGGFVGSLLQERGVLSAARGNQSAVSRTPRQPTPSAGLSLKVIGRVASADSVGGSA